MRIIKVKTLKEFWAKNPDSEIAVKSWYQVACNAKWSEPANIKAEFRSASILKDSRVVFNLCGNKYRLVVKINYPYQIIYIRFIGSHKDYDKINAEVI